MSRILDAVIAYRILKLLVTPFNKTQAYKLGIIDDKGKVLIKSKQITTQQQRKAYTLLIRFVFNLKRLLGKVGIRPFAFRCALSVNPALPARYLFIASLVLGVGI